ncbi:hypothetical protein A3D07_02025 [Candidatus Curtissbacteria bacterium RIFCSPHIGHO2_02_FULL_42_15]|uniref:Alanine--tRNA ligase n=1 Tax=Candidatus Curtissbacteria bacterium RIFCSPHIGHO2_02_FULL_42_15 TaxID=1797716 RepID=A0A1F5GH37_9BACT|nr:MAG: hypothetical protein A3D07_02025 [Candidatus Curtissbacteria bacterium RIFCSPHIGHO2_02_FULL_42_15]
MKSAELRQKYLKFFEDKGHKIIPSASLVPPENVELAGTQRVMFTTAGMHPLVPYLLGTPHPKGSRLVNIQRCLRTDDIDDVGDNVHNTFFEMLGNWSLGDYWKEEAISWSFDFLINHLKLDAKRIYVSVFAGDSDAPFDEESYNIWLKLGVEKDHIYKYGKKDNWWGPIGQTGPCGPDTEMFYDLKGGSLSGSDPAKDPAKDSNRFVEIWNDVFMQYDKKVISHKLKVKSVGGLGTEDFEYVPLKQRNVDTGMGLERMLLVLQDAPSIYETDVFLPAAKLIEDISGAFSQKSARIVADHLRAAVFLISDGVTPSNVERGYVLRRLIRRAIRHANLLEIKQDFLEKIAKTFIEIYGGFYPNLVEFSDSIVDNLKAEEQKFKSALTRGLSSFQKLKGEISGKSAFDLYQNFGFPIELTLELAKEQKKKVDTEGFEKELKKHQELSRQSGEKTKGGLAVQSDQAAKLHTATHLLHQALRDVLGKHVHQTGSHITDERLRFDFAHSDKMTDAQIKEVEKIVNQKIKEKIPLTKKLMTQTEADKIGAIGLFREKYQERVSIYLIGDYSAEYCGGPHASSTDKLGEFNIIKEESAGSGIRRIYAKIGTNN